jgi:uncharacterized alkaline shock family protein YloU
LPQSNIVGDILKDPKGAQDVARGRVVANNATSVVTIDVTIIVTFTKGQDTT